MTVVCGQYVRCPVFFEEKDEKFPRNFIMAKIVEIHDLSDSVTVKIYDLCGTKALYEHIFQKGDTPEFPLHFVARCHGCKGAKVMTPDGRGKILVANPAREEDTYYSYYVTLYNGEIKKYTEDVLEIEYTSCDYSPVEQMVHYEFQNPSWYTQRLRVSENMHLVDNSIYGFDVISGCRAFLMEHQITTIARAFESRPIRYMLADEVGLGKTIEACSIIKIMNSENSGVRVLYIVPRTLLRQWQTELKYKYELHAQDDVALISFASQFIVPLEEFGPDHPALQEDWDLLVVDETHRLLSMPEQYQSVFSVSKRTENVLLLSATPIQDRKEEYLNLLKLLLPAQYENMPMADFSKLLKNQEKIQRRVNRVMRDLSEFEDPDRQEEIFDLLDELAEMLDDKYLKRRLPKIDRDSDDHGLEDIRLCVSYITENYRVQRKVIRNRRCNLGVPIGKRQLQQIPYEPCSNEENYGEINVYNALLQYLSEHCDDESYVKDTVEPLLMAMFSSPWALLSEMQRQKIQEQALLDRVKLWVEQGEDEIRMANEYLDERPDEMKSRLLRAVDYIEQEIDVGRNDSGKVVVFTGFAETHEKFMQLLQIRKLQAVAFRQGMTIEALEDSVYEFQNTPECKIMVCDETGGEGRNFQNADWIIHLDLPWTANAIEQRIGRLDRLGRDEQHMVVHSVVLFAEDTIESQLFQIWNKGMQLFEESLSGLEIITGELNEAIVEAMADDLQNGLNRALDDIIEITEDAKDAVEEEQLYDSGTQIYKPLGMAVNAMLKLYQSGEGNPFQVAMLQWATQAGLVPEKASENGVLTRFSESRFRPHAAMQALLVPPRWKKYKDTPIMRRSNTILGTFDRATAIKREDLLFFAPGDSVFDSIVGNAVHNGRGRCCAFMTPATFDYAGFAFTYNIGPNISFLLDHQVPLPLLSQFGVYLPVHQIRVFLPLRQEYEQVPEADLNALLNDNYHLRKAVHLGERAGKEGTSKIEIFMSQNPSEEWSTLVKRAAKKARKIAMEKCKEESDLVTAKKEIVRVVNGYEAEYIYLGKNPDRIEEIKNYYRAVFCALEYPTVSLDSVCYMRVVNRP